MTGDLLQALEVISRIVRVAALAALAAAVAAAALGWAVRTRRVNAFGRAARFARHHIDPRVHAVEARVVRAGMNPVHAPWILVLVVSLVALLAIFVADTMRGMVAQAAMAGAIGGRAMVVVALGWIFGLLRLALLVRVVSSWIGGYGWWVRWSNALTDWMIRPLQRVIPNIGVIDLTPLAAYFALVLLERVIVSAMV